MTSRKASKPQSSAPYLRDLRDLTIHASIDASGDLVILPIFNTLGGDSTLRHMSVCGMYAQHPVFKTCMAKHQLVAPTTAHFIYPSLTTSLPLPAPTVIDHTLQSLSEVDGTGEGAGETVARIKTQLQQAAGACALRFFIGTGYQIDDLSQGTIALHQLATEQAGILSPPAAGLLAALEALLLAVDAAAAAHKFVLLSAQDLTFALGLPAYLKAPFEVRLAKPSWGGFYQELQQGDLAHHLAAPEHRLAGRLTMPRLLAVCQRSIAPFALIPDVGEAVLRDYLREAHRHVGALSVKYQDVRGATQIQKTRRPGEKADTGPKQSQLRYAELFTSAWMAILSRASAANFYPEVETTAGVLAEAWSRRYEAEGAFAALQRYKPTRPIAAGGALIAQSEMGADGHAVVRLTPAVVRPEVAAQKVTAKRLQDSSTSARLWLKLGDLSQVSQIHPLLPSPAHAVDPALKPVQVLWPQAELWQTVDMVKTLAAFPGFLLNPETLAQGFTTTDQASWEQVAWPEDGILRDLKAGKSWPNVHAWFTGAAPWPLDAKESVKRALYHDTETSDWTMTLVASGMAAGQVRLSVRYAVVGSPAELDTKLHLAQVLHGLQNARTIPNELYEAFLSLGESLRFEARPYFEVDGQTVTEADWFAAVKVGKLYMRLPNGVSIDAAVYAAKTEQFLLRQKVYSKFANLTYNQLWQVHRQASEASLQNLLPEEYVEQLSVKVAPVLQQLDTRLMEPIAKMLREGPLKELAPHLREYQEAGVAWCYLRLQVGLGVCLADEMGLGKTIQAMALLLALKDPKRPSLVVMPKTVMINWQRELARFAPEMTVRIVEDEAPDDASDVWLISYPRLRLGSSWLQEHEFQLVVLDEAQAIKNTDSQTTEAAGLIQAKHRLALTGTPVENHAGELWSLVHWLNPGYLGRVTDFMTYIKLARSSAQKKLLLAPLKACLEPLMLRRTKADPKVRIGLPEKVHQDHVYEFSSEQTALYEALLEVVFTEEVTGLSAFARRALFLKAILHAKQICVHPELFYGEEEAGDEVVGPLVGEMDTKRFKALLQQKVKALAPASEGKLPGAWLRRSGKLATLADLLPELMESSRGILMFTQYLGAARLLRRLVQEVGNQPEPPPFLHGGLETEARQQVIDDFNDACFSRKQEAPILILSLKAGGTGLNLTGADRVIHVDRWWNPAVEDQATDRTHRMGQTSTVFVHTLTSNATIEESIGRIFADKRRLADDLLGAAESEALGNLLGSSETFLDLMDPQRIFSKRMLAAGVPLQLGKGNKAR